MLLDFQLDVRPDQAAHREPLRRDLGTPGGADARDSARRDGDSGFLAEWHPAGLPWRVHQAHPDAADVRPGSEPVWRTSGPSGCARPGDDPHRWGGGRRLSGDAVLRSPSLSGADVAGGRGRSRAESSRPDRSVPAGDRRDGETSDEIKAASSEMRALLAFDGSTPAYHPVLEVEGRADLQPELNALSKTGAMEAMDRPDQSDDAAHPRSRRHPRGVRDRDRPTLRRCRRPGLRLLPGD